VKVVRVDEALETKPLPKTRVVEVEFSPEPRVVHGKVKPGDEERVPALRVRLDPMVRPTIEPLP
jgi:hypothetical protein